ncbi:hypothetical protein CVIRNUC_009465 [Coccomyxa viridis]|uniref:NADH dehydrogenase [ubiquinone] 1 beta subcomplex subunit 7 n=1 Tax=Coccomyxa viridis TaxID=1274662 RepID=A0AAV1IJ95_9CHLO|nr:hypothetical protein CVIRNUC_009465 [Coccomyxa viridis]
MASLDPPPVRISQEELRKEKVFVGHRDFCAHLLVPLNKCRRKTLYLPWKCEHERHVYEKCEYQEYKRRVLKKQMQDEQSSK